MRIRHTVAVLVAVAGLSTVVACGDNGETGSDATGGERPGGGDSVIALNLGGTATVTGTKDDPDHEMHNKGSVFAVTASGYHTYTGPDPVHHVTPENGWLVFDVSISCVTGPCDIAAYHMFGFTDATGKGYPYYRQPAWGALLETGINGVLHLQTGVSASGKVVFDAVTSTVKGGKLKFALNDDTERPDATWTV